MRLELTATTDILTREAVNSVNKLPIMEDTMTRIILHDPMEEINYDGLHFGTPNVVEKTYNKKWIFNNYPVHKLSVHGCIRSKLKIQTLVKFIKCLLVESKLILKNKKHQEYGILKTTLKSREIYTKPIYSM